MFYTAPKRGRRPISARRSLVVSLVISLLLTTLVLPRTFFQSLHVAAAPSVNRSIDAVNTPVTEDFNTLASTGTSSTVPTGWAFSESGTNANTTYTASDGTGTGSGTPPSISGDTYSFGSTGSTERAFGGIQSGSLVPIIGASFTNNTGVTISSLAISYTGEQWRLGTSGRADRIDFQYSTDATSLTTGTYNNVDALDFSSPNASGTAGPLDGNSAGNRAAVSSTITGLSIPNGATFFIRWTDFNASGADDGLSVDDFSITANPGGGGGSTNPSGVGSANPATVAPGDSTLLSVTVTPGSNPTSTGITVTADLTAIGGSSTQQLFDDGAHEDGAAGDNIFAVRVTVSSGTPNGQKSLPVTITDAQARAGSANISLTVQPASGIIPIHDIQGSGNSSPFAGQTVTTQGIVTGLRSNGFFIQIPDASADANTNTSEGVLVFTSSAPPAAAVVGNLVNVTGTVSEFIPSSDTNSPPETELTSPTVSVISTGNTLPTPVTLTAADTLVNDVNNLEKYEGMRVRVDSLTAVSPTQGTINEANATATSNGVFYGVITGVARPFREPGIQVPDPVPTPSPSGTPPPNVPRFDSNPERLRIDSDAQPGTTALDVTTGAVITNITGPLDYAFRTYTILPDTTLTATPNITATPVPTPASGEFTIGSFNMQRFYDTTDDPGVSDTVLTTTAFNNRLNKASLAIRNVMRSPDIIGIVEMENLSTLQAVATKVNNDSVAAGQPNPGYTAYLEEGNDIGGIDVGFLVKSARVNVISVTQFGKTTTYTEPGGTVSLLNDRPPLVLVASINRPTGGVEPITVIVNHLRSLSGINDPVDGSRIRAKRKAQAEYLANLIQTRQTNDPTERILSVGDYNAFQFNDGFVDVIGTVKGTPAPADQVVQPSADLVNPDLTDLIETLPATERYTFTFDGNAQTLDHELANTQLMPLFSRISIARNNGDFPQVYYGDPNRSERVSDHDMPVAYFNFVGGGAVRQKAIGDFDGDLKTDLAVWRAAGNNWFISNSQSNTSTVKSWGDFEMDRAVPGDYDGDGRADIAVVRINGTEGNWYIIQSLTNTVRIEEIGIPGDIPVPADYDGDGKTDVGIWRPSTGGWVTRRSSQGNTFRPQVFWGSASLGDIPVPADYDGDGRADIAVFRPSEGNWYVINSSSNTVTIGNWGRSGDQLVPGDYDGDGRTDLAVYRPSDGNWYIRNSGGSGVTVINWGTGDDRPVPGDYDGDGRTDIAVFRQTDGNWYIINSTGRTISVRNWGQSSDLPLPATYIPR